MLNIEKLNIEKLNNIQNTISEKLEDSSSDLEYEKFIKINHIQKVIEERLKNPDSDNEIQINGHFLNGEYITKKSYNPMSLADWFVGNVLNEIRYNDSINVEKLKKFIDNPQKDRDEWVELNEKSCLLRCPRCGVELLFETNGVIFRAIENCTYPEVVSYSWELNIPSGKMVVENDLRSKFIICNDHNVNLLDGMISTTFEYADAGMSHAFVGNSCPAVYKKNDKEFIVSSNDLDLEQVTSICTDLWWYSIVDYDQFVQRYGEPSEDIQVVECNPGVYQFLHIYDCKDTDDFTHVYKIRDPDPIADYSKTYNQLNLTAGQCLNNIINNYPYKNIYPAISTMMCCIGTGSEFHPNGFFYSSYNKDLTNNESSVEIPRLEKYEWYPICEYSPVYEISLTDIKVDNSFVELSFNILNSIISYGHSEEEVVDTAKKCLKSLKRKYRKLIPNYIKGI